MQKLPIVLLALVLAACAGTYEPATSGPTITLRVEPDIKPGVPVISYADLTLSLDQLGPRIPGTNFNEMKSLGWQKVAVDKPSEAFILPADKPLQLALSYRTDSLFGPTLTGSRAYVLVPEAGNSYVMKFWTDKERFSVNLFRQDQSGNLVPARAMVARQ
jgi:hypothetical protein